MTDLEVEQDAWQALWRLDVPGMRADLISALSRATAALNDDSVDIVVLAARRMACIYAVLIENGFPRPERGAVLSDRFATLQPHGWWAGKRVLLIDDTSLTGETLDKRSRRLQTLSSVASVSAEAAVKLRRPQYERDEVRQVLHSVYARTFAEQLMPYLTDFPVSKAKSSAASTVARMLNDDAWWTADVTNAAISGMGPRNYTLFPKRDLLSEFLDSSPKLRELVEVAKLRLFTVQGVGRRVELRAVPIVLIGQVEKHSARHAAALLGLDPHSHRDVLAQAMGLISYLVADRFMQFAQRQLPVRFATDDGLARLFLGAELLARVDAMRAILDDALDALVPIDAASRCDLGVHPFAPAPPTDVPSLENYFVIGDDMVDPIYRTFLESRDASSDPRRSWPVAQLAALAGASPNSASLGLDVLNDLGLVVPEVDDNGYRVARVFRAGEVTPDVTSSGRLGGHLAQVPKTYAIASANGEITSRELIG